MRSIATAYGDAICLCPVRCRACTCGTRTPRSTCQSRQPARPSVPIAAPSTCLATNKTKKPEMGAFERQMSLTDSIFANPEDMTDLMTEQRRCRARHENAPIMAENVRITPKIGKRDEIRNMRRQPGGGQHGKNSPGDRQRAAFKSGFRPDLVVKAAKCPKNLLNYAYHAKYCASLGTPWRALLQAASGVRKAPKNGLKAVNCCEMLRKWVNLQNQGLLR